MSKRIAEFQYRGHTVSARETLANVALTSALDSGTARPSNAYWAITVDGVECRACDAGPEDLEHVIEAKLKRIVDDQLARSSP